jgi:hypothetical protein
MTEMFNNIIKNDSRRRESDVSASRNTFWKGHRTNG